MIEVTALAKTGGPLTKRISLSPDGMLHSDGSACIMSEGAARRAKFRNLLEFADYISGLGSTEAIALGALHRNLPETVRVVTKRRLEKLNGTANSDMIARTSDYIAYEACCTALALIDIDTKGMPATVGARIRALGGFWPALVSVLPELSGLDGLYGNQLPQASAVLIPARLCWGQTGGTSSCWCRTVLT